MQGKKNPISISIYEGDMKSKETSKVQEMRELTNSSLS